MNTARNRLFFSILILLVVFSVATSLVSYTVSKKILMDGVASARLEESAIIRDYVKNIYMGAQDKLDSLVDDYTIMSLVDAIDNEKDLYNISKYLGDITSMINLRSDSMNEYGSYYILTANYVIKYTGNMSDAKNLSGQINGIGTDKKTFIINTINQYFSNDGLKSITDKNIFVSDIGSNRYLIGILDFKKIFTGRNWLLTIIGANNNILYNSINDEKLYTNVNKSVNPDNNNSHSILKYQGSEYVVTDYDLLDGELKIINVTNMNETIQRIHSNVLGILILNILVIVVFAILFFGLSAKVVKQLNKLTGLVIRTQDVDNADIISFMQRNKSGMNMRRKVFVFYTICIIPLLLIILINYSSSYSFKNIIIDESEKYYYDMVKQYGESMEYKFDTYINFCKNLCFDVEVQRILYNINQQPNNSENAGIYNSNKKSDLIKLSKLIFSKDISKVNIKTLSLYDKNLNSVYTAGNISGNFEAAFDDDYLENKYQNLKWEINNSQDKNLTIYWKIYNVPRSGGKGSFMDRLGYLCLSVDNFMFQKINRSDIDTNSIKMLVNEKNELILTSAGTDITGFDTKKLLTDGIINSPYGIVSNNAGNKYLAANYKLRNTEFTLLFFIPFKDILSRNLKILYYNIIILILIIILLEMLSALFARKMSQPIESLRKGLELVKPGNMAIPVPVDSFNEITMLAQSFNDMLIRIDDMSNQIKQKEIESLEMDKRKKEAQMVALQAQMNPHFLYNIFSSINFLLRLDEKEEASRMIDATANFMRNGLYRGKSIITLNEEVRYANSYIDIQKMRYKERIGVFWDCPNELLELKVPKFVLQPIIENAIEHGLKGREKIKINIIVFLKDNKYLMIEIRDNGTGIPEDKLNQLQDILEKNITSEHLGMANVNERIHLYFGGEYGIDIQSSKYDGTNVTIMLPATDSDSTEE